MNILAINNNSNTNLWNLKKNSEAIQPSRFGLKMSEPLAKDTVSFRYDSIKPNWHNFFRYLRVSSE